ncbi:hypothetical protein COB52_05680 [Candidatus Kaiserbacteria bacterium]|nr:MAG: hypothetical protein COB52_05680 [Candidatus Kaiserbacteria bacterium]
MLEQHGLDMGNSVGVGLAAALLAKFIIALGHCMFRKPTSGLTDDEKKKNNIRFGLATALCVVILSKFCLPLTTFSHLLGYDLHIREIIL